MSLERGRKCMHTKIERILRYEKYRMIWDIGFGLFGFTLFMFGLFFWVFCTSRNRDEYYDMSETFEKIPFKEGEFESYIKSFPRFIFYLIKETIVFFRKRSKEPCTIYIYKKNASLDLPLEFEQVLVKDLGYSVNIKKGLPHAPAPDYHHQVGSKTFRDPSDPWDGIILYVIDSSQTRSDLVDTSADQEDVNRIISTYYNHRVVYTIVTRNSSNADYSTEQSEFEWLNDNNIPHLFFEFTNGWLNAKGLSSMSQLKDIAINV
ncbi:hypothetical protein DFA_06291 [Cavenderia fasciculata]|uniref:Uncharacterized protein n=1 Tax=Cavenderia fasciculata TaxID=261658 RepID=F4PKM1_CACFS|nr:uncharacterized protein DFA_06291 [Cavenderia fasciculata]EGG24145.1 hypothetical protein DFA_06291 [Cavenderia fasciculata]|eukprot:XP_004361996.1 hypothetical protein DFA_06291 [Cavenderia fasciculata]